VFESEFHFIWKWKNKYQICEQFQIQFVIINLIHFLMWIDFNEFSEEFWSWIENHFVKLKWIPTILHNQFHVWQCFFVEIFTQFVVTRMTWIIIEINLCEYKIDKSINKIEFCVFDLFKQNYLSLLKWVDDVWLIHKFDFEWMNQSNCLLNDVSVYEYIKRYIEWYIVILYWFIYSHSRSSWMRVVFDFNALASDSAPFEPIWFPVEWYVNVCVWIYKEIYCLIYYYLLLIWKCCPFHPLVFCKFFFQTKSKFWKNNIFYRKFETIE
jgi:hypothetical protein